MSPTRTRLSRLLSAGTVVALLVSTAACSSDSTDDPESGGSGGSSDTELSGSPTRFHEVDWEVTELDRRDDLLVATVEVSASVPEVELSIPSEWLLLTDESGDTSPPSELFEAGTDDSVGPFITVTAEEPVTLEAHFESAAEGANLILVQPGYLPAALTGGDVVDEAERVGASFDPDTYSGTFSRDEATVSVVDAFWSRELGVDDAGELVESPDNLSRRPPEASGWLLVHFEVACSLTTIDTGGCNVSGGQVDVDGQRTDGSRVNGVVDYGETESFWAAYPVAFDAASVTVHITGGGALDDEAETAFVISDLAGLMELATP